MIRPDEIEVSQSEPFRDDLLKREPVAKALNAIIEKSKSGLVICLYAPWGYGKSTFLKQWQAQLLLNGRRVIWFNAWESDFIDDPLVALIGELSSQFTQVSGSANRSQLNGLFDQIKRAGGKILRHAIPTLIKVGTSGVLNLDQAVEEPLGDVAERIAQDRISEYEASRASMQHFKSLVAQVAQIDAEDPWPLVFIIDELDRCRPNFAIKLLECIKHLFSTKGVVFLLASDRAQLANAVRREYGSETEAAGYLRRFFDVELYFPAPDLRAFTIAQFDRFGLSEVLDRRSRSEHRFDRINLEETLVFLFEIFHCSLRDVERSFSAITLAIRASSDSERIHPHALAVMVVLKIKRPDLYEGLRTEKSGAEDIYRCLETLRPDLRSSREGATLDALMRAAFTPKGSEKTFRDYFLGVARSTPNVDEKRNVEEVLGWLERSDMRHDFGVVKYLWNRIDLVAPR